MADNSKFARPDIEEQADGLVTFEAPESSQVVRFETEELSAVCPFEFGGPDFYEVELVYTPDEEIIESKSLKQYFEDYRDEEISHEDITEKIYTDLYDACDPEQMFLKTVQNIRGGLQSTVSQGERPDGDE